MLKKRILQGKLTDIDCKKCFCQCLYHQETDFSTNMKKKKLFPVNRIKMEECEFKRKKSVGILKREI